MDLLRFLKRLVTMSSIWICLICKFIEFVNVENLRLCEPPLIDDQGEHVQIPSIDDFSPEIGRASCRERV